jgi:hypothetical protein
MSAIPYIVVSAPSRSTAPDAPNRPGMKTYLNKPLYSATDLLNFLGCTHSTVLDLEVMRGQLRPQNDTKDEYLSS